MVDNLYWNVYRNLEKELLNLSEAIHIDDEQLSVYSMKIADLLIRVAVEIESISKALYIREGGTKPNDNNLYFDTDCLKLLDDKWTLSEKVVMVSSPSMYFNKDENKYLTPLHKAHKRGSRSSDWQKAYQAVKHNRVKDLKKGNLKHFIRALAALYILNLYYMDQTFDLKGDSNVTAFDASVGSSIFSIRVHSFRGIIASGKYQKNFDYDKCIYLIQATHKTKEKFLELLRKIDDERFERLKAEINIAQSIGEAINIRERQQDIAHQVLTKNVNALDKLWRSLQYEAVLNKNQY